MSKRKPKALPHDESTQYAKQIIWAIVGVLVSGVAFGGWKASQFIQTELAFKNDVIVAQAQAQTALDLQMEDIMERLAHLRAKPKKDAQDHAQIRFLEGQLERVRKMRAIK